MIPLGEDYSIAQFARNQNRNYDWLADQGRFSHGESWSNLPLPFNLSPSFDIPPVEIHQKEEGQPLDDVFGQHKEPIRTHEQHLLHVIVKVSATSNTLRQCLNSGSYLYAVMNTTVYHPHAVYRR